MEVKKCAECGKPFSGRGKYCSDTHYRPCPICGTPVIAKYLSDPARRCDKCKGSKAPANTSKPKQLFSLEPEVVSEMKPKAVDWSDKIVSETPEKVETAVFCEMQNGTVRIYIGPEIKKGFIPGHEYLIHVEHDGYTYVVTSKEDLTSGEDVDIAVNYSSQISFHQHLARIKEVA